MTIAKIFIDRTAVDYPMTSTLCRNINAPAETVESIDIVHRYIQHSFDPIAKGKQALYITTNRGRFIRSCPGTRSYHCCGYQILHIGTYCTMDCAYCILQSYFHPPLLQFFVNHDQLEAELDAFLSEQKFSRIGTGEFTDSLIWEPWTGLSKSLIIRFSKQANAVLELKTKTTAIDTLLDLNHNQKTILAWSLNTPKIIQSQERKTAPLRNRLEAAAAGQSNGYPLAFHFDPLVIYDGCEHDYAVVIDTLFQYVRSEGIAWISLGTFRFMPSLKPIIASRFSKSNIIYGEFISGLDGKMRYFKPLRIALYQHIVKTIREYAPNVLIYFCMEDDEVWQKTLGFIPAERGGLSTLLDDAAVNLCDLGTKIK